MSLQGRCGSSLRTRLANAALSRLSWERKRLMSLALVNSFFLKLGVKLPPCIASFRFHLQLKPWVALHHTLFQGSSVVQTHMKILLLALASAAGEARCTLPAIKVSGRACLTRIVLQHQLLLESTLLSSIALPLRCQRC